MASVRGHRRGRQRVRIGAPDPTLTPVSGMLAVSELVERLDVIGRFDAVIGPIKQRRRGHTGGHQLLQRLLVGTQVALAIVLLTGAGLMIRSFVHAQEMSLGLDVEGLRVHLPERSGAADPGGGREGALPTD